MAAWPRRNGGGGSAKRGGGGGAQRNGCSAVAAARRLRRWRQRDSETLAAAWRRRGGGAQRDGRGSLAAASAAVAAARNAAAAHSGMVAGWWQQHGGCGGFTGTVRECADARAFERHQRADVRAFVLGRGRRDDSADGIVVIGSNGGTRGDVHRSRQCAAAPADDSHGDADTLFVKLKLIYYLYHYFFIYNYVDCHAAADVALSRCRHRRSLRAAATALPPSCCSPPPHFALLPQPLTLPP